jgi:hypothetical protein
MERRARKEADSFSIESPHLYPVSSQCFDARTMPSFPQPLLPTPRFTLNSQLSTLDPQSSLPIPEPQESVSLISTMDLLPHPHR